MSNAWDTSNPLAPWAIFDTNAVRDIPLDWSDWIADIGGTYSSHTITAASPLECVTSSHSSGVITARIKVADGAAYIAGTKYPIKCSIVMSDGQRDDRTVWLKLVER